MPAGAKALGDAGIKLDSVASDVLGGSGRLILKGFLPASGIEVLAELAKGTLRKKPPALRQALYYQFEDHQAILMRPSLEHMEQLEAMIAELVLLGGPKLGRCDKFQAAVVRRALVT